MLAKNMHQILQIDFKNCILFFSFWGEVPPDTPIFSMAKGLWCLRKASKKWEE